MEWRERGFITHLYFKKKIIIMKTEMNKIDRKNGDCILKVYASSLILCCVFHFFHQNYSLP